MRRVAIIPAAVLAVALVAAGCSPSGTETKDEGAWVGTITTEGDVTTVVNESGSVWGGTARLVEEASIGVDVGADEYMFGYVSGLYVANERIYVADWQVPAVRTYSLEGDYLGDLGGEGEGPGEYQRPALVGGFPDGRVFLYDVDRRHINVYSAAGEPIGRWPAVTTGCCDAPIISASDQSVWVRVRRTDRETMTLRRGLQEHGPDGPLGPVRWPVKPDFEPIERADGGHVPLGPEFVWATAVSGAIVAGASDRYRFEIQHADGRRRVVHRYWDPVPIPPEHADYARRVQISRARAAGKPPDWTWDGAEMPSHKPAFDWLVPAMTGEIWVIRRGRSQRQPDCVEAPLEQDDFMAALNNPCWGPEWILDVFSAVGRYLGEVESPENLLAYLLYLHISADGETVLGVTLDSSGVYRVKRYRLMRPETSVRGEVP